MVYLNLLPISNVLWWFGGLMLIVYIVDFFWSSPSGKSKANNLRETVKKITADLLTFLLITSVLVHALHPKNSPWLMALVLAGIIVTSILGSGMREVRGSYRLGVVLIHILLSLGFYFLFGMMLMDGLTAAFNLNMTDNFDILYFAYGQERVVVYGFFIVLAILYFVIGKLYMRPVYRLYAEAYKTHRSSRDKAESTKV